jgi:hypothetical protein
MCPFSSPPPPPPLPPHLHSRLTSILESSEQSNDNSTLHFLNSAACSLPSLVCCLLCSVCWLCIFGLNPWSYFELELESLPLLPHIHTYTTLPTPTFPQIYYKNNRRIFDTIPYHVSTEGCGGDGQSTATHANSAVTYANMLTPL